MNQEHPDRRHCRFTVFIVLLTSGAVVLSVLQGIFGYPLRKTIALDAAKFVPVEGFAYSAPLPAQYSPWDAQSGDAALDRIGAHSVGEPLCLLLQWPIRIVRRENDLGYVSHQERFNSPESFILQHVTKFVSDQMTVVVSVFKNNAMAKSHSRSELSQFRVTRRWHFV
jgi:hypothetical protein